MSQEPQTSDDEESLERYESGPVGAGIDWTDPNLPVAPLYMTSGGVIGVALLGLLFIFILAPARLWHTDFWGHLKYGEWIAANGKLPDHEPLCQFTDKQAEMFDAMWLSQVAYHGLFRTGGAVAGGDARHRFEGGVEFVRLAHALAAVATVLLLALAYRRVGDSVPWAIGGVFIVLLLLLSPLVVQRPQGFALTCFATVLFGLSRPIPTRGAVVWIPLVVILWANLHASFAVGLGLIGVVFLGRVIELGRENGWSVRGIWRDTGVRRLLAVIALSVVGSALLNPYGPAYYLKIARFGNNPNLATFGEWQPLDFSQPGGGHWLFLLSVVLLVVTQVVSPRPFTPAQMIFIVTLGVWPLFQQRAMIWWAPIVPWIIAPHWVAAAGKWGISAPESVPSFRKTALAVLLIAVMVVVPVAVAWANGQRPRPVGEALHPGTPYDIAAALKGDEPANPQRVEKLVRVLRGQYGGKFTGRVFCSETAGEYLLWALPPETPVMLFNHIQLFPPAYWAECQAVKFAQPGWWEVLDRYRPGVIVVEVDHHPRLCAELRRHPDWVVAVDEADRPARDRFTRLFVAVRKSAPAGGNIP